MLSAVARSDHDRLWVVGTQGQVRALEHAVTAVALQPVHQSPYSPVELSRCEPFLLLERLKVMVDVPRLRSLVVEDGTPVAVN